ncbi:VTT domain-containing protein [Candidatus Peregrinibacteria bacterium]|nr:VTT domain-containing protein [Candidatus Peregrinibacteria bacterium]
MFQIIEAILHLDKYLQIIVNEFSSLTYALLFLIIFFETGIVITPFLPGDSLLFAAGALAATGSLKVEMVFIIIFIAAVLGDTINYHIGKWIGPKIFKNESSIFFHKKHLVRAQKFYEKYGKKTIIFARFIPIIRTFAPFVAGIGTMPYGIFLLYNILGGLLWSCLFIFGGFLFGNIPWVKEHFGLFIIAIIISSFIPFIKEIISHFSNKKI